MRLIIKLCNKSSRSSSVKPSWRLATRLMRWIVWAVYFLMYLSVGSVDLLCVIVSPKILSS